MSAFVYTGSELELFAHASHWKAYLRSQLAPFIGQRVLEVGAGTGNTTKCLCAGARERWVCLEPDAQLREQLRSAIRAGAPAWVSTQSGTVCRRSRTLKS
jgi:16S rRNA A1518/A1519 N6-dimethyltransferase RsmA/KsgA/DIM1 with predicted DNA glycosylase/AP lyase activity